MHLGSARGSLVALLILGGLVHVSEDWLVASWGNWGDSALFHLSLLPQQASPSIFSWWLWRHKRPYTLPAVIHHHCHHVRLSKTHHKRAQGFKGVEVDSQFLVREMQWHVCREVWSRNTGGSMLACIELGWARHGPCAHLHGDVKINFFQEGELDRATSPEEYGAYP